MQAPAAEPAPKGRTMPRQKPGQSRQDYGTPLDFIAAAERLIGARFQVDLAASPGNAKAPGFFTAEQDSLSQPWHQLQGWLWLNPPYANIGAWAAKCAAESALGAKIAFLVPASVGANWYRDHVHGKAYVLALNGRLTFEGETQPFPKDCILALFGVAPGFEVWSWQ